MDFEGIQENKGMSILSRESNLRRKKKQDGLMLINMNHIKFKINRKSNTDEACTKQHGYTCSVMKSRTFFLFTIYLVIGHITKINNQ